MLLAFCICFLVLFNKWLKEHCDVFFLFSFFNSPQSNQFAISDVQNMQFKKNIDDATKLLRLVKTPHACILTVDASAFFFFFWHDTFFLCICTFISCLPTRTETQSAPALLLWNLDMLHWKIDCLSPSPPSPFIFFFFQFTPDWSPAPSCCFK